MKKRILFVMNNLTCGGAEKSLVSLLENLDYRNYIVDLFLMKHEGIFLKNIPSEVNLLKEPIEYLYFNMPIKKAIIDLLKKRRIKILIGRLLAGFIFKTEKNSAKREQRVWKYISSVLPKLTTEYDIAIGFLEKNPIYFCVDKVSAKRKIGFIHNDYDKLGMDYKIDAPYFNKLHHILTVSDECVNILKNRFPMYENKIKLMYNIVSPYTIKSLALEKLEIQPKGIMITSVGRLTRQKGFDIAIEACELLVKDGFPIKWFVVGEGEERKELEELIKVKGLEDNFFLVGLKENPYPYINKCDVYVQTSIFEGRCLTITEAKILNKPIVSTDFKVIYDQLENGENGLIVNQDPVSVADAVKLLINNKSFCERLINNLTKETIDTQEEIQKFYNLIS